MGMGWMMAGMVLFWAVLIFLAVLLVKALFEARDDRARGSQDAGSLDAGSPMAILDLRYSRGEITREQYLQMRRDLEETDRGQ